jgi:hypothetical protein
VSARGWTGHGSDRILKDARFSPQCGAPVAQEDDGEAAVAKIEVVAVVGSGIGRSSTLCRGEKRRIQGAGSPWVARTASEDEENPRRCTPPTREPQAAVHGATAGASKGRWCARREEMV